MRYCTHCGAPLADGAAYCMKCGNAVEGGAYTPESNVQKENDAPNTGFAILSFFFPLVGLILWLVWKDEYPLKAKSAGKGALIGAIVEVVLVVLCILVYISLLGGFFGALYNIGWGSGAYTSI